VIGALEQQDLQVGRVDHDQDGFGDLGAGHVVVVLAQSSRWLAEGGFPA